MLLSPSHFSQNHAVLAFLRKRWFLVSLAILIPGGLTLGATLPAAIHAAIAGGDGSDWQRFVRMVPRGITAIVLFLMSFSLDSRQLKTSFRSPKPVVWASLVNFGLIPLLAWPLMSLQTSDDFALGLMIAACAPCTMAAASVWTRKAGGNDAVSLLVTLLTNATCFAVSPFWLGLATGSSVDLGFGRMVVRLLVAVLVPMILGQLVRQLPPAAEFAKRHKTPLGVVAQSLILLVVFQAAFRAGAQFTASGPKPGLVSVAIVWASCIALHLVAMRVAVSGSKLLGFTRPDMIATAFAGSQKTLPIGVLLATDPSMFGDPALGVPFVVFPMLMYHASQLFIDTAIADRFAGTEPDAVPEG